MNKNRQLKLHRRRHPLRQSLRLRHRLLSLQNPRPSRHQTALAARRWSSRRLLSLRWYLSLQRITRFQNQARHPFDLLKTEVDPLMEWTNIVKYSIYEV